MTISGISHQFFHTSVELQDFLLTQPPRGPRYRPSHAAGAPGLAAAAADGQSCRPGSLGTGDHDDLVRLAAATLEPGLAAGAAGRNLGATGALAGGYGRGAVGRGDNG